MFSFLQNNHALIIISSANHLLHIRPQQNSVLKLRSITSLDITEGWVRFHDARRDQMVQAEQVFVQSQSIQISSAPWQSAKVLVDGVE
jgi:hypothetical protein